MQKFFLISFLQLASGAIAAMDAKAFAQVTNVNQVPAEDLEAYRQWYHSPEKRLAVCGINPKILNNMLIGWQRRRAQQAQNGVSPKNHPIYNPLVTRAVSV
jgi:hypothetical protein